jgi:hypothetical protein
VAFGRDDEQLRKEVIEVRLELEQKERVLEPRIVCGYGREKYG